MGYWRGSRRAIFAFLVVGGISAASAGVIATNNYGDATVTEYSDAASLSVGLAASGPTTSVNFNGIASTNSYTSEGSSFTQGPLTFDDDVAFATPAGAGGALIVYDNGYSGGANSIGTGEAVLQDNESGDGIDITFPYSVKAVGLIIGDPDITFGIGGVATFNLAFAGGSTDINNIGTSGELPLTGGANANYYEIVATGAPITEINFNDNAGFPTIDTVSFTTPEPSSFWLLGLAVTVYVGVRFMRKHKPSFARRALGAAPVAVVAGLAFFAAPVHSFAQVNCNIAVPNNPLTAVGLATPYLLSAGDSGCSQAAGTMAFVQAAIYDPAAHTISVYTPLVADAPSSAPGVPRTPRYAISPVVPKLPANAIVAIWFGYNANNLTLTGTAVTNGTCFTGFGQFAACNTTNFWNAVNADTTLLTNTYNAFKGQTGSDGLACPTARSFSIVDQDPTDNLPVSFLLTTENPPRVAQNTMANQTKLTSLLGPQGTGWNVEINPSDEAVVDVFIDGALGCNPPMVADLTDSGTTHASYAVNELFAGLESGQFPAINSTSIYGNTNTTLRGPGLVAIGDTFTLNPTFTQPNSPSQGYPYSSTAPAMNPDLTAFDAYVAAMGYTGQTNAQKISGTLTQGPGTAFNRTVQYRAAANQPAPNFTSTVNQDGSLGDASVPTFCKQMFTRTAVGDNSPADLLFNKDASAFQGFTGPTGASLFIFLGDRFAASYDLLGCAAVFGQPNPVNVTNVNNTTPPYYPSVFPPSS